MKKLLILTSMALSGHALHAGQPAPSPAATATVVTAASGPTAGSVPVLADAGNDHNPFWPIGWVKSKGAEGDAAAIVPRAGDFNVTSILINEPPMAVINGKEMAEGEVAAIPISTGPVTVQLIAVQDGRVILRWENQDLVIPLHRDEGLSSADLTPTVGLR